MPEPPPGAEQCQGTRLRSATKAGRDARDKGKNPQVARENGREENDAPKSKSTARGKGKRGEEKREEPRNQREHHAGPDASATVARSAHRLTTRQGPSR